MRYEKNDMVSLCYLAVLPPVFPLEFGSTGLKLGSTGLQGIGTIIQIGQLLVSFQDLIDIHSHDVHHLEEREDSCYRILKKTRNSVAKCWKSNQGEGIVPCVNKQLSEHRSRSFNQFNYVRLLAGWLETS